MAVAIDLSKAFDTSDHEILLTEISLVPINSHIKRFLFAYLRGRMTFVEQGVSNEMKIQLPIFINRSLVPTIQKPKLLGVILDSMFTFKHHAISTVNKLQNRNNILKVLAGTSWDMSKKVLLTTYWSIYSKL